MENKILMLFYLSFFLLSCNEDTKAKDTENNVISVKEVKTDDIIIDTINPQITIDQKIKNWFISNRYTITSEQEVESNKSRFYNSIDQSLQIEMEVLSISVLIAEKSFKNNLHSILVERWTFNNIAEAKELRSKLLEFNQKTRNKNIPRRYIINDKTIYFIKTENGNDQKDTVLLHKELR